MKNNLDSMGIEEALQLFPDQVRGAWKEAVSTDLPSFSPKAVIISGIGGSSLAARFIVNFWEDKTTLPIFIHNDYGLPKWLDKDCLVVGNSYSGNTEETISSVDAALKIGCKVMTVSTGGKLYERVQKGEFPGVKLSQDTNPPKLAKSGFGISLGGLLGAFAKTGLLDLTEETLFNSLTELEGIRNSWKEPQEIAEWMKDSIPVLFAARPLLGSVQAGRNVIDEIGRTFAVWFDFPEVNHVLVEATMKPAVAKEKIKYLFLYSDLYHDRVKLRYKITQKLFKEQGLSFKQYDLKGEKDLTQALEIPHLCAWLAFHLSVINNEDPGPEPWIIYLKKALGQPVH